MNMIMVIMMILPMRVLLFMEYVDQIYRKVTDECVFVMLYNWIDLHFFIGVGFYGYYNFFVKSYGLFFFFCWERYNMTCLLW